MTSQKRQSQTSCDHRLLTGHVSAGPARRPTNLGIVIRFVGVVLKRQPPVRLFDGVGACVLWNTKHCVVVVEHLHRMSEQVDREV